MPGRDDRRDEERSRSREPRASVRDLWPRVRGGLELSAASATARLTAVLLVGALVIELAMIGSYVAALHAPEPRDVPIAVAGPPTVADAVAQRLGQSDAFDPRAAADAGAALRAIDERDVYAALVVGRSADRLVVAPAASAAVADLLPAALRRAEPPGRRLVVSAVRPLPASDPRGLAPFYLVVGWVVGGYLGATILGLARGGAARDRRGALLRLGALAAYAAASGLLGALLVQEVVGVLEGRTLALAGVGALVVFATGAATAALQSLLGIAGTALAILLFVALGNPGSGGPLATELLMPGLWRDLGPLLPPGAGTEIVRNVSYFDANAVGSPLLVLLAYALLGSLVAVLAARSRGTSAVEAEAAGGVALAG